MRFKLDENLPSDLAARLQQEGHDVADVAEQGLEGEVDPTILNVATDEGRVLMTFDLDFADIREYPPGSHAGIVVFRLHDQRWRILRGPVNRLLAEGTLEKLQNGLAVVDESRVRFKRPRRKR